MSNVIRMPYREHIASFISPAEYVTVSGGKGSGKTWCGTRWVLSMASHYPGTQGIVMWNTLQQARDIWRDDFQPLLDAAGVRYRWNEQQMLLKFNGCRIHFRSAEENVIRRIESIQYNWGWVDEAQFYSNNALKTTISRIRKPPAIARITCMPAEPEAFIYTFSEDLGAEIFDIGLYDNPDKDFVQRYEKILRATYKGEELNRYLHGARVSLSGLGVFPSTEKCKADVPYDPKHQLLLSWDFNVAYCAVSAWQITGVDPSGAKTVGCVRGYQLKAATAGECAEELAEKLDSHAGEIILAGDASGQNRNIAGAETVWRQVKGVFRDKFGSKVRISIPKANPSVRDTIELSNWAMQNGLVTFDRKEAVNVTQSLTSCKYDRHGEIDKKTDYQDDAVKSHEGDTVRYALWYYLKSAFNAATRVKGRSGFRSVGRRRR